MVRARTLPRCHHVDARFLRLPVTLRISKRCDAPPGPPVPIRLALARASGCTHVRAGPPGGGEASSPGPQLRPGRARGPEPRGSARLRLEPRGETVTASALDRVLEVVVGRPFVEFALVQGPGGAIVASAGPPPRWAPEAPDPADDGWGPGREAGPDVTLEVGLLHVLHLKVTRAPTDEELERIRARFLEVL